MPTSPTPQPHTHPALTGEAHAPFLALLPQGGHLLEAGCGTGEDLRHFREQGLVVTAFDASLAQASAASRLCGQPVRVCRFEQMRSVLPYDGLWASASLPCLEETELAPVLTHLAGLLKPGAPLYCSFPHAGGPEPETAGMAASAAEYPLRTRLDEARLGALIARLPFASLRLWCAEDPMNGRWLHALLVRSPG